MDAMMLAMSDIHETQVELYRGWIHSLMMQHRITASELARRANLSESTLTRLMNPQGPAFLPREATIAKIEKTFSVRRPVMQNGNEEDGSAPGQKAGKDPRSIAAGLLEGLQELDISSPDAINAYTVEDRALDLAGYLPGDIVLVDTARHPEAGDIVALRFRGPASDLNRITLRIFDHPFLSAHSTDAALRRPVLDDREKFELVGIVTTALRAQRRPRK